MPNQEPDSPTTGSSRPTSRTMLETVGSILERLPPLSRITGQPRTDGPPPSGIGLQPSGRGVAATPHKNPLAVFQLGPTAEAARLGLLLGQALVWGERSIFQKDGQFERTEISDVKVRDGHSIPQATLNMLEKICAPCGPTYAAQRLGELRLLTASRERNEKDTELMALAYTDRLADYPADVVLGACNSWANAERFWPTWADLKDACDRRMRGRKQLRDALRRAKAIPG